MPVQAGLRAGPNDTEQPTIPVSDLIPIAAVSRPPRSITVPEQARGVACDLDTFLLMTDTCCDERIARARERLGRSVVILGHRHLRVEVIKFADFRGDSLK